MRILSLILVLVMPLSAQGVSKFLLSESETSSIIKSPRMETPLLPIHEGRIIEKEGDNLFYIAPGNRVMAKQISLRKIRWEQRIKDRNLDSVYVSNKVVIVTSGDNFVYGLDKINGKLLWSYGKLHQALKANNWGITPKVAISDKTAYIAYDNSVAAKTRKDTIDNVLVLHISLIDGKIIWQKEIKGREPSKILFVPEQSCLAVIMRDQFDPTVHEKTGRDRTLYGKVYLLNAGSGEIIKTWASSTETILWDIQTVDKQLIVTGRGGYLFIFNMLALKLVSNLQLKMVDVPYLKVCADTKKLVLWDAFPPEVEDFPTAPIEVRNVLDGKLLGLLKAPISSGGILDVMCDSSITRVAHVHGVTSWPSTGKEYTLEKRIDYVVDLSKEKATVITDKGMEEIIFPAK